MEEQTQDVNPAESSPVEQSAEQPQESSEETLNTAEAKPHEEAIPYERFQEVNFKLKDLQESQDWVGYQKLKETLDNDPAFASHFLQAVQSYYQQQQQPPVPQKDPYAEYPSEIADPLRKISLLEQQNQYLMSQSIQNHQAAVGQQYMNRFNEKIASLGLSEPWKNFYQQQIVAQAGSMNPNALNQYDQNLLDRAFEAVDQQAKALNRSGIASYITDKSQDKIPASTSATGTPGRVMQKMNGPEDRASMVAELLRAGNR